VVGVGSKLKKGKGIFGAALTSLLQRTYAELGGGEIADWWQSGGKDCGGGQSRQSLEKYITENRQAIVPYNKAIRWIDLEAT
jgi:hypothetical protein